jgi:hypothetical protein
MTAPMKTVRQLTLGVLLGLALAAVPLRAQGGPFASQLENFWRLISTGGRTFTSIKVTGGTITGVSITSANPVFTGQWTVNGSLCAAGQLLQGGSPTVCTATPFVSRLSVAGSAVATSIIPLYLQFNVAGHQQVQFENQSTDPAAYMDYVVKSGTVIADIGAVNLNAAAGLGGAGRAFLDSGTVLGTGWDILAGAANGNIRFATGGYAAGNERVRIDTALSLVNNSPLLWITDNAADIGASGATRPRTGFFGTSVVAPTVNATTAAQINGNSFAIAGVPTISSGFGTSPSVSAGTNHTSFRINVGTGGTATGGVIGLPTAPTGWTCQVDDITEALAATAAFVDRQTASSTTTATIVHATLVTGVALAYGASDILAMSCFPY